MVPYTTALLIQLLTSFLVYWSILWPLSDCVTWSELTESPKCTHCRLGFQGNRHHQRLGVRCNTAKVVHPLTALQDFLPNNADDTTTPTLSLIPICNHRLDPMYVCGETSQLDLLALASFNCERICINPFVCGDVRRIFGVC